jgi:CheY-like chemotaxis protein
MMSRPSVLLIEDDKFKADHIEACAESALNGALITNARSVQAAVQAVSEQVYDVVLLDMALPSHDLKPGGGPAASLLSGGVEILMELSYHRRTDRVIVITQYPEIEIEGDLVPIDEAGARIAASYHVNVAGVIFYEHESPAWEKELTRLLEERHAHLNRGG